MSDSNYRVTAIRLENFMGFANSGWIELRRITLLFGRNSSGKSAIIRALLMLKQSLGRRASTVPLVLSGELVDLGTFQNMVRGHDSKLPVAFSFKIERLSQRDSADDLSKDEQRLEEDKQEKNTPSWMKDAVLLQHDVAILRLAFQGANSEIRLASITVYENDLQEDQLVFRTIRRNNQWEYEIGKDGDGRQRVSNVPVFIEKERRDQSGKVQRENSFLADFAPFAYRVIWEFADFEHLPALRSSTSRTNRDVSFVPFLTLKAGIGTPVDKDVHKDWRIVSEALEFFRQHIFTFLEDIVYLKPLRDEAKRFYSADEDWVRGLMEPDGKTLTVVNQWLEVARQDAEVDISKLKNEQDAFIGRVEVQLKSKADESDGPLRSNLRDVGTGISQVLPVIVKSLQAGKNGLVIIEQPELHLHPAAQAALADLFIELAANEQGPRFLLETHSEHILLRLQRRVAETTLVTRVRVDKPQNEGYVLTADSFGLQFVTRTAGNSAVEHIYADEAGRLFARTELYDVKGQDTSDAFNRFFRTDYDDARQLGRAMSELLSPS